MNIDSIISINFSKNPSEYNWFIKRHCENFKDTESKIIGVKYPWQSVFKDEETLNEIKKNIQNEFNEFIKGSFYGEIGYHPIHRDIFIVRLDLISSNYFLEFIYTKDTWKLKSNYYTWEEETFIVTYGLNTSKTFIVSKLIYKIDSESFDYKYENLNFGNRKFKSPIFADDESLLNSNYIFYFSKSDGLRTDLRLRRISLLIDEDFDYFLEISSNEYSSKSGKQLAMMQQGQIPITIVNQLLFVVKNNVHFSNYGKSLLDLPVTRFAFKINKSIKHTSFRFIDFVEDQEYKNLKQLETLILDWIEKIIEFQIKN